MKPKLKTTDMWVVSHIVGKTFHPVAYTASYTRKDSINAFMSNSTQGWSWQTYAWPYGCYAVLKMKAIAR